MLFSQMTRKRDVPPGPRQASNGAAPVSPATAPASGPAGDPVAAQATAQASAARAYTELKVRMHQRLLETMNLAAIDKMPPEQFQREVGEMVRDLLREEEAALNLSEQTQLVSDLLDEVLGLGPLEPLLKDETVTDILVNTAETVFVERHGLLETTPVRFKDNRHLLRIIGKIAAGVGRRIDESQPMVDARLADGSRVNAIIQPLAVDGPLLSIRKFRKDPIRMDDLVCFGALTDAAADVLRAVVRARRNVLISGGTGSGKTTMLNALSAFIDNRERIITIEDAAELQLQQDHVARMETRPANIEGRGEVTQRELVKNALRMRPDRIILGEIRAGEAFDMLQAMNTGHDGSMTTVHANSCRDALSRLEQMIGMSGMDLPAIAMRRQIASAIHVVLQLERQSDGRRRLTSVSEITGMEGEIVQMQEIFRFERRGVDAEGNIQGTMSATGVRPKFMREIESRGLKLPAGVFEPGRALA